VILTTYDEGHYIILSGLQADHKYFYRVKSKDINGNEALSAERNFTTDKDISQQHEPLSKIEDVEVPESNLNDKTAVITFITDQPSLCYVELDTVSTTAVTSVTKFENGYLDDINYNAYHAVTLSGLNPSTEYTFDLSCHDNIITVGNENAEKKNDKFGNWKYSEAFEFTTKEEQYTASGAGALSDRIPPAISNVKTSAIDGESVIITWDTDENGNSSVGYGINEVTENGANNQEVNSNKDNYVKSHSVFVNGLVPATKYVFVVTSLDSSGNISQSTESSFTTASPSSLSSIKVESKNLGEAIISWKTDQDATSIVEYGLTTSYSEKKEDNTLETEHSISLSNLNQGNTYHYRVKGKDKKGRLFASSDNTFEPKSPAKITDIAINNITEHGATVTFKTNVPTDARVTFTDLKDNLNNSTQGVTKLTTEHEIVLTGLDQGTTFSVSISVRDEQGTESLINAPDLTTGQDTVAPKIDNVKTDLALAQSDKVQTIISWKTDEQATTSIIYKEGRNGEEKELKITDNLTTGHVGVITSFKAGTVYNYKAKSIDASGNVAISGDFALLTPKKRENIIQIIIGNFIEIFGWARN
jgi:hypothetical protein